MYAVFLSLLLTTQLQTSATMYTLDTTLVGGNSLNGNMFDLCAKTNIQITSFDINCMSVGSFPVEIYASTTIDQSYALIENVAAEWTLIHQQTAECQSQGTLTVLNSFNNNININNGDCRGFYVTLTTDTLSYTNSVDVAGTVFVSNMDLDFQIGIGKEYPFGTTHSPRVWNGRIHYYSDGTSAPAPTVAPSNDAISRNPTQNPTLTPTNDPISGNPTQNPTVTPTNDPISRNPTHNPTLSPTKNPTQNPISEPTNAPSFEPTKTPTSVPTNVPSFAPTNSTITIGTTEICEGSLENERCTDDGCVNGAFLYATLSFSVCRKQPFIGNRYGLWNKIADCFCGISENGKGYDYSKGFPQSYRRRLINRGNNDCDIRISKYKMVSLKEPISADCPQNGYRFSFIIEACADCTVLTQSLARTKEMSKEDMIDAIKLCSNWASKQADTIGFEEIDDVDFTVIMKDDQKKCDLATGNVRGKSDIAITVVIMTIIASLLYYEYL